MDRNRFRDTFEARENDSFRAFFKDVLSDTLTSVMIFLILAVVAVAGISLAFGVPFLTALGFCALMAVGLFIANFTGWL